MPILSSTISASVRFWRSKHAVSSIFSRALSIFCQGKRISRDELFTHTNGRYLVREKEAYDKRYLKFDLDQLCAVAASAGGSNSPIRTIEKMEGGFSKTLLMSKEDGTEVAAKLPFSIAGPPKYLTASEAAVLQYLHDHTPVPVPKILAFDDDASNLVGSEYIIMEKAAGCQLVKKIGEMGDSDHFEFIKNLCKVEADLAAIAFPANGSLYLRTSMGASDKYIPLAPEMDPTGHFCIGPSCERSWFGKDEADSVQARFDRGPWPTLSAFGVALAEREIARIEHHPKVVPDGLPRVSPEEQVGVLRMAQEVFSKMDEKTLPGRFSWPTLWHTDLHSGNIFVSDKEPTQITSLIDWQSNATSPLFYQVRFPVVMTIGDDYELGHDVPTLPDNIDEMDEDDQAILKFKHKYTMMAKAYEAASGFKNKNVFKSLRLPPCFRKLFLRCEEAWEEGVVPLRISLIDIAEIWNEAGFSGDCPYQFSEEEIHQYRWDFQCYQDYHRIFEIARKGLDTDSDGWVAPGDDFEEKRRQNKELLEACVADCADFYKTAEEIRKMWPY